MTRVDFASTVIFNLDNTWRFRESCANPRLRLGLQNSLEFSAPASCLDEAMQTRKRFSNALVREISGIRADLIRHNHVNILSFHTYRPMRAFVVSQLFYKLMYTKLARTRIWLTNNLLTVLFAAVFTRSTRMMFYLKLSVLPQHWPLQAMMVK